jgi:SAM-dependent methyltransferase
MANIALERTSCCPACNGSESEFWAFARDRLHQTTTQEFEYRKCHACGSLFQSLRPAQADVWQCYPAEYGPHGKQNSDKTWSRLPKLLNSLLNRLAEYIVGAHTFRRRLAELETHLSHAQVMLDFGCGSGKYLDRAKKFGCKGIGMDFSPQAIEQVRARGHTALMVDDESWSSIKDGSIGFVRMNHVIEHLYQPSKVLGKIHTVMSNGAILHVSTPNPAGHSATKYRSAWFGLDCPRHIVLIPPERMLTILHDIGFDQIEIIQDPHPKDLARSWAYSRMDIGRMKGQCVSSLANDGLLNLMFSWRIMLAMKQKKMVDRYHIIARKRLK